MIGLYWEDWTVGRRWESSARTVTETDIVNFAALSGDWNRLHTDAEYCKSTQFGERIAHGPLVYAIAAGLLFQLRLYDDTLVAFLGFEDLRFTRPTRIGDTIRAVIEVTEQRESSKPDRGLMRRRLQVLNQRNEVVQEGIQAFLLKRREPATTPARTG